jgi:hypothetical protein
MPVSQTRNSSFTIGEEEFFITVTFEANPVRDSYGVPGSPVWTSYDDCEIDWPVEVDGVDYDEAAFNARFTPKLADQVLGEMREYAISEGDWD